MSERDIAVADLGPLTPREAEAVLWTAQGKTAWEAGTILGVTAGTLNAHVAHAAEKLNASNRAHLVARAFVAGVLVVAKGAAVALALMVALSAPGQNIMRVRVRRGREDGVATVVISRTPGGAA